MPPSKPPPSPLATPLTSLCAGAKFHHGQAADKGRGAQSIKKVASKLISTLPGCIYVETQQGIMNQTFEKMVTTKQTKNISPLYALFIFVKPKIKTVLFCFY